MKRIILILGAWFLIVSAASAGIVDTSMAKNTGKNFIYEKINTRKKAAYSTIELQCLHTQKSNNEAVYYIFSFKNQPGYIIVSAEDETFPVLGYSYEKDYMLTEQKPPAFIEWMKHYTEQIDYIRKNNIRANKEVKDSWLKYSSKPIFLKSDAVKGITPLLSTNWNQGKYYNELCPADVAGQDGHVWVGCVAVAMAQIMKYWNYPDYGSDEHSYDHWNYGTQTANFADTYYDWASMPNSLGQYNTALATLLYHCGVAVNMNYKTSGSGAYSGTAASSLKRFFDYSHTLYLARKYSFTDSAWKNLIKSELDLGHPLYYSGYPDSGSGHAFNCDGYDGPDHFHFNWGWGGSYNGYFYLDDLTPGSRDYTYTQAAIINAYPDCLDPVCDEITIVTDPSGTLNDGSPLSGYFTNYSNCSNCEYLLQPTNATSIFIEFDSFSTIEGEDSLYVYDGADDTAPLLLALSGDTLPNSIITSGGSAYFYFVSDNFRTAPGWNLTYTSALNDVGVTWLNKPVDKTCGNVNDSIEIVIKNFGVNAQTNIPVNVDVNTPTGSLTYNAILPGPLARNQSDTLFAGIINTIAPGNYFF
ncbi:MAG: C10 family peptidase, partial [Bacteroidota bacterium]|nr:C10 family peptidase [Bacteroidota bacterium]